MQDPVVELVRESVRRIQRPAFRAPRPEAVRLDLNELPELFDDQLRRGLADHLASVETNRYPDGAGRRLRALIAGRLGVKPECVALGNGSEELIWRLTATFAASRGGLPPRVLYPVPTFPSYRVAALANGMEPVEVPLAGLEADEPALLAAIQTTRPNLIFVCRPNTPTGLACPRAQVERLIAAASESLVVIDEAYVDFGTDGCVDLAQQHPNVIVLRTLSKIGLASLRIGYAIARQSLIEWVERGRPFFVVGGLNQAAAEWLLERHEPRLRAACARVCAERERVRAALAALPDVVPYPSLANFYLVRVPEASRVWNALAARHILVGGPMVQGELSHCLRVAVGSAHDNDLFVDALEEIVRERPLGGRSPSTPSLSGWLHTPRPVATPRARVFCFHHAGGSAQTYYGWEKHLPHDVELCAVQLPGRSERFNEPPQRFLGDVIDALATLLTGRLDRPFAFFGHSMGALIAFELTRALRRRQRALPAHILLSARPAPENASDRPPMHSLPRAQLLEALAKFDGLTPQVLAQSDLLDLLLPMVRADLEMAETWVTLPEPPLVTPITVLGGEQDKLVAASALEGWRRHTVGSFALRLFPGGHFFLNDARGAVLDIVRRAVSGLDARDPTTGAGETQ